MKILSHDELKPLSEWEQGPCVSIYLPRHQAVAEHGADAIHLRNFIDEAERLLQQRGLGAVETRQFLESARSIQNDAAFWERGPAQGLCLLLAPGFFRQYDLTYPCPDLLAVDDAFYLSPLFYRAFEDDHFHVLAVSPKSVRIFRHQHGDFSQLDLPENVPANLEEISAETEFEESLQFHTTSNAGVGGENAGMLHGHGLTKEQNEKLLSDYFQILAKQLEKHLDPEGPPLLLVAAEKQQSLFRKHFQLKNLLPEGIQTSPDRLQEQELLELALPLTGQFAKARLQKAANQYREHLGTARISHQLEEILQASSEGRVESLFTPLGETLWGTVPAAGELLQSHSEPAAGDTELLNYAVRQTYLNGGTPYVIESQDMPESGPLLAFLRW